MALSNLEAVKFGLSVMYAEDMFIRGQRLPAPEPRIEQLGWKVVAYFVARDAILGLAPGEGGHKRISLGPTVFYGYVAQSDADPSAYVAAIRGTESFAEWIIDAEFVAVPYPRKVGAMAEQGFWDIYDSMELVDLDGVTVIGKAAEGVAKKIGAVGKVTVVGHSLGSALATYLSLDMALLIGDRAFACMFASPHAGNDIFAAFYDTALGDRYSLYNYVLDLVPYVPFSLPLQHIDYAPLPKAAIITPMNSQADVRVEVGCSHHVICYCAELDYQYTNATPKSPFDQAHFKCVLDPRQFSANEAMAELLGPAFKALLSNQAALKHAAMKMGWTPA